MLSNSFIFVVMKVMHLIPIYPIKRQTRLEMKARTNHKPKDVTNSKPANAILPQQITYAENAYNTLTQG